MKILRVTSCPPFSVPPAKMRICYTQDDVLDKLIAAGLGGVDQNRITPDQWARAMRGEKVIQEQMPRGSGLCPRCKGKKQNQTRSYCRACSKIVFGEWKKS